MAKQLKALVISKDGQGERIRQQLESLGFSFFPSGNGHEGAKAVQRYQPALIIIFLHPNDEEDVTALRAAQDSLAAAIILSQDVKRAEKLLLGVSHTRVKVINSHDFRLEAAITSLMG